MSSRLALTRGVEETRATGSASAEGEWAPRRDLVPTLPRGNATSDALRLFCFNGFGTKLDSG